MITKRMIESGKYHQLNHLKMISGSLIMMLALTGCSGSKEPNYYSLSPRVMPAVGSTSIRVIEVMPVGLADRLNRIPIVVQDSSGRSNVLSEQRWTSTLSAELRDGLSAGLQQKLGAVDRYNSGMTGGKPAYRIATDFSQFDIIEQSAQEQAQGAKHAIHVAVAWTIKYTDPNKSLVNSKNTQLALTTGQLSCRMTFKQPVMSNQGQLIDAVNTSRMSLEKVIDAVAASVIAVENNRKLTRSDLTCG